MSIDKSYIDQEICTHRNLERKIEDLVKEYNSNPNRVQYIRVNKTGSGISLEYYFRGRT